MHSRRNFLGRESWDTACGRGPFNVAVEIAETAKDGLAVVNRHIESRVTGLEVEAATTQDRLERPPAPAC